MKKAEQDQNKKKDSETRTDDSEKAGESRRRRKIKMKTGKTLEELPEVHPDHKDSKGRSSNHYMFA